MRLDDHIFEEVAMALGAAEAADEELRLRRATRYRVEGYVLIKPHGVVNSTPRQVQLINISAVGVCIIDHLANAAGNQFVIYLPRAGGATMDVICTVRQARLGPGGAFRVGAEFTSEMEGNTRLVRGVDGVISANTVRRAVPPQAENTVHLPAQIRVVHEGPGAARHPAEIREASGVAVSLVTSKSIGAGEEMILEFVSGRHKNHSWRCTATHVRMLDSGQFRVNARINRLAPAGKGSGMFGWLRRLFRQSQ
jgi:hypothetical protein